MLGLIRLAWRERSSVVHLAIPAGPRRYESACSNLPHRLDLDPDLQQLQGVGWDGKPSGDPLDSTWLGDDRAPTRRLCRQCAGRWRDRIAWVNAELEEIAERAR